MLAKGISIYPYFQNYLREQNNRITRAKAILLMGPQPKITKERQHKKQEDKK